MMNKHLTYEEWFNEYKDYKDAYKNYAKLQSENDDLKYENQQLKENYDRIYNENCKLREEHNITDISLLDENQQLKKQKDDVVELIKARIKENEGHINARMEIYHYKNMLRMLGEIDE